MELLKRFLLDTPSLGTMDVLINIVLAGIMSYIIRLIYIKYGTSLSNRKHFANSFLLITVCTSLIIALIQSSIALSLGLVGALSIIRFRTAIKEPQELTYIFLCVALGLGFGANERLLTLSAGALICVVLVLASIFRGKKIEESFNLMVKTDQIPLDTLVGIISECSSRADLRRFDETPKGLNAVFFAEFKKYDMLSDCKKQLKALDNDIEINFVATRTMG